MRSKKSQDMWHHGPMAKGFDHGLVSVIMCSLWSDMSVCMVVASKIHHGSCEEYLGTSVEQNTHEAPTAASLGPLRGIEFSSPSPSTPFCCLAVKEVHLSYHNMDI